MSPTSLPCDIADGVLSLIPSHLTEAELQDSIVVAALRPDSSELAALVAARVADLVANPSGRGLAQRLADVVAAEGPVKAVIMHCGTNTTPQTDEALARVLAALSVPVEGCWSVDPGQLGRSRPVQDQAKAPRPDLGSLAEERAWVPMAPSSARRSARRAQIRWWDRRLRAARGLEAGWRLEGLAQWRHWCAALSSPASTASRPGVGRTGWSGQTNPVEIPPPALGRIGALLDDPIGRDAVILTLLAGTGRLPEHFAANPDSSTALEVMGAIVGQSATAKLDSTVLGGADQLLRLVAGHQAKDCRGAVLAVLAWLAWRDDDAAGAALLLERVGRCENIPAWAGVLAELVSGQVVPRRWSRPMLTRCQP